MNKKELNISRRYNSMLQSLMGSNNAQERIDATSQIDVLDVVFALSTLAMENEGLFIGGVAMIAHTGQSRESNDIDLMMPSGNAVTFLNSVKEKFPHSSDISIFDGVFSISFSFDGISYIETEVWVANFEDDSVTPRSRLLPPIITYQGPLVKLVHMHGQLVPVAGLDLLSAMKRNSLRGKDKADLQKLLLMES